MISIVLCGWYNPESDRVIFFIRIYAIGGLAALEHPTNTLLNMAEAARQTNQ